MALPPAWLAVQEVFESYRDMHDDTAVIAQSMVAALESRGLRIVPAYAVDERRLRVTLGLAELESELDALERYDPGAATASTVEGRIVAVLGLVRDELIRATSKFGSFASQHEGWAVLREEVDELWEEVKHGTWERASVEAVQVAAMGARFVLDLGSGDLEIERRRGKDS